MMNRSRWWMIAVLLAAGPLAAHEAGMEMGKGDVTKQGEVVDLACYMGHEAHGAKHQDCAEMCVKGGMPMGLVTSDGKVYLLLEDHTNKTAYEALKSLAAQQAKVMGDEVNRGGLQAIVVERAQKA